MEKKVGLLDNEELIDSMLNDLNNIVKGLVQGQYLMSCTLITGMVQKLTNLKKGYKDEMQNRNETIEELKRMLREAGQQLTDIPAEELLKENEHE